MCPAPNRHTYTHAWNQICTLLPHPQSFTNLRSERKSRGEDRDREKDQKTSSHRSSRTTREKEEKRSTRKDEDRKEVCQLYPNSEPSPQKYLVECPYHRKGFESLIVLIVALIVEVFNSQTWICIHPFKNPPPLKI